jgi:MFS family permease
MSSDLRPDLRILQRRVQTLEDLLLRLLAWGVALLLAVGLVLPYAPVTEESDEDDVLPRLLTAGFRAVTYRNDEGEGDGFSVAVGIGFLGLLALAVVAGFLLAVMASGFASERTVTAATTVGVLLVVGTGIAGLLLLFSLGSDNVEIEAGWGWPVFALGVAAFLAVTRSQTLRELWDPQLRP